MQYITSVKDLPHERPGQGTNGDYPEISFTFISQVIEGMMGIEPDAGKGFVNTLPRLPDEVKDIFADHVCCRNLWFGLRHKKNESSILENEGEAPIIWEAGFYGAYKWNRVRNDLRTAKHKMVNGKVVSYVTTSVEAGESVAVCAVKKK